MRQTCGSCDSFDKKEFGCRKPLQQAVWDDGTIEFRSCPMAFITPNIRAWHEKYRLVKKYGGFNYDNMNCRDVAAYIYFDSAYSDMCRLLKRPEE